VTEAATTIRELEEQADARRAAASAMLAALKMHISWCDKLEGKPATVTSGVHAENLRALMRKAIATAEAAGITTES
jgi:hypothetical protein